MRIKESGIIVFMENYESSLEFYVNQLGFQIREQKEDLSILYFGNSYLMIEKNGVSSPAPKKRDQNPTVLRLDLLDFDDSVKALQDRGVLVDVHVLDWGTIAAIIDPEGNRIELKKS
ncbi:VOC family protein [Cohnella abietis]|uniref:Glyoxalase n=1 Tax=Cohnella abietis TaxID=2507935 RepID=A0A3T1D768_9BACL|nr:VOC family protein [Cohnella abietis]BBI33889.1 glyoxalase [Cohnella abietis]